MWILLLPVIVAEIMFWGGLTYCAWRAFKAFRHGNWALVAAFSGLISLLFIVYFHMHNRADMREAARATEISALARSGQPQTYPSLLEVYGYATEFELLIFLDALRFDDVIVFQHPRRSGEIYGRFVKLNLDCKGLGVAHLETWKKRGRFGATKKKDKNCLVAEWKTVSSDRATIPALEYRHGTQSTLLPPGNNWASGAYEVRLRAPDGNKLVAYWERPFITRPAEPGPWGYAFPSNTDWNKYKQPKRLDFLLQALRLD